MIRDGIEWRIFSTPTPYPEALAMMEARVEAIQNHQAPEAIWLMDHPALITTGRAAPDILPAELPEVPVLSQTRGGGAVYYGPGLRMAYAMLRVADHAPDIGCFVRGLEKWAIAALEEFNLRPQLCPGRLGVWVPGSAAIGTAGDGPANEKLAQICSLAVRVRRGISFQGLALHVEPDLAVLQRLRRPSEGQVTSLVAQGYPVTSGDIDVALMRSFSGAMESVRGSCTIS